MFTFAVTRAHRPNLRTGPDHPGAFTAAALSLLRDLGYVSPSAIHLSAYYDNN